MVCIWARLIPGRKIKYIIYFENKFVINISPAGKLDLIKNKNKKDIFLEIE